MIFQASYSKHTPMHVVCVQKVINLLMPKIVGIVKNRRTGMSTAVTLSNFIDPSMDWDFSGSTKYEVVDEIINYLSTLPRLKRIQGATRRLEELRNYAKRVMRDNYTWLS